MVPLSGPAVANLCNLMVETMPIPAVIYDSEQIVYVNPAMQRLLRSNHQSDVVGHSVLDFVHPDSREATTERTRIILANGVHISHVGNRIVRCDGTTVHVTLCGFPLQFGSERLAGVFFETWDE